MQVQQLVGAAQQAMQTGRFDEAARLWEQVLAAAPEHPQALFHLAQYRLLQKQPSAALKLFERAAKADPDAAAIPFNIAIAQRAMGNSGREIAALDRALTLDPQFLPALLAKGAAFERLGRLKQAAKIYQNALSCAPPDDQLPAELRNMLQQARTSVDRNAEKLRAHLQTALDAARTRNSDADFRRLDQCLDVMLGQKRIFTQQPTMLHFPGLPAIQFYDRDVFPWIAALEAATDAIREEFRMIYREDNAEFVPYIDRPGNVPMHQWAELNRSPRWSVFYFWKDGRRMEEHCHRCPQTAAAVDSLPLARIPTFGPNVNFSALAPRTRIPPHTGSTNARLILHLPLIVPEGCLYRVGNESHEWEEGKAWVFDDTIEHEAWNGSDSLRVILMADVWNPYLTQAERELVCELLCGVKAYYADDGKTWDT